MKRYLALALVGLALCGFTATQSGNDVKFTYTEPTTNSDGSPLTDLAKTIIYYDIGAGPVVAKETPATKATGGGTVSATVALPVLGGSVQMIDTWATAVDTAGNQSSKSERVVFFMDKLAPAPPK